MCAHRGAAFTQTRMKAQHRNARMLAPGDTDSMISAQKLVGAPAPTNFGAEIMPPVSPGASRLSLLGAKPNV